MSRSPFSVERSAPPGQWKCELKCTISYPIVFYHIHILFALHLYCTAFPCIALHCMINWSWYRTQRLDIFIFAVAQLEAAAVPCTQFIIHCIVLYCNWIASFREPLTIAVTLAVAVVASSSISAASSAYSNFDIVVALSPAPTVTQRWRSLRERAWRCTYIRQPE